MKIRKRTREQARHGRAVVLQELAESAVAAQPIDAWKRQQEIECARMKAARRRRTGS